MSYAAVIAPRPHPRVVQAPLRDDLALFHLDTRRLHLLNGPAAAIWSALQAPATTGAVAAGLAERFGVDAAAMRSDVERTIAHLLDDGLLRMDDESATPVPRPRSWAQPSEPAHGPPIAVAAPRTGSFEALDARVGVICADEEILATIGSVLAPLHCRHSPEVAIEISAVSDTSWTIRVEDHCEITLGSRLSVALRVIGEINNLAVASVPDDLVLHAGAVSDGPRVILLPAASNRGKSTLTTALVAGGLSYLTDEAAAIQEGLIARPFPKSIALDPGSFPLFESLCPPHTGVGLAKAMAGREWHIDPDRVGAVGAPAPVAAVVCPHWRAGASTRLTRMEPSEALHVLLGESFDFTVGGQPVFARLVELVDRVGVFRLGYSDLDEAVGAVRAVLD